MHQGTRSAQSLLFGGGLKLQEFEKHEKIKDWKKGIGLRSLDSDFDLKALRRRSPS